MVCRVMKKHLLDFWKWFAALWPRRKNTLPQHIRAGLLTEIELKDMEGEPERVKYPPLYSEDACLFLRLDRHYDEAESRKRVREHFNRTHCISPSLLQ